MRKLPVDLDQLTTALEHDESLGLSEYWLDTMTGAVLFVSTDLAEDKELRDQIEEDVADRFVRIDPIDSRDQFQVMEDFVRSLPATPVRERLELALAGRKPFGRFKDSLGNEEVRKQWFAFHDEAVRHYAITWLADLGIQPEGVEVPECSAPEFELLEREDDSTFEDSREELLDEEETGEKEDIELLDSLELPLSDEEQDELTRFLEGLPGGQFDFPKLHGLLTALVVGPVMVSPQEILEKILSRGSKADQPASNDLLETEQVLGLIARLQNEIIVDLHEEIFEPACFEREHPSGENYPDTFSWCEGFVLGMNYGGQAWKKWYRDSRRELAISAIEGAANREFRSQTSHFETAEKMLALNEIIQQVVPLIRYFWWLEAGLDEIAGTGVPLESQPKVGRNAPCPCGSGKKFKHCCGETRGGRQDR
jgi:uncharacterized protein